MWSSGWHSGVGHGFTLLCIQCHSYGWPGCTRCHTRLGAIGCASFVVGPTGTRLLAVRAGLPYGLYQVLASKAGGQSSALGGSCWPVCSSVTLHCIALQCS